MNSVRRNSQALRNTQMFALQSPPPETLAVNGADYRIVRVFKHDFWAATCLYERCASQPAAASPGPAAVVVKYGRARDFCGIALGWYAHAMADHEQAIYRALAGVPGVPAWVARLTATSYAIEYVPSESLDRFGPPPRGFFDRLRQLFDAVHANGVAYTDSNKRSNILVGPAGEAFLVDFQISMRRRDDLHWPLRAIVRSIIRYMQGRDLYHIYKHKRRLSPAEMTDEEMTLSRRRGFWHAVHRRATDPYRFIRRAILRSLHRKGALKSPTDHLEDLVQPEKATWRE